MVKEKKLFYVGPPNRVAILASTMRRLGPFKETNVEVLEYKDMTEIEVKDALSMTEKGKDAQFELRDVKAEKPGGKE